MGNYVLISVVSGFVFGMMDGVINGNPYAQKLFEVYKPIAKTSINVPLGLVIDLVYGFVMAGVFMVLYKSLPGESGWMKGVGFGLIMWFFRVVMYALSQGMMFKVSVETLGYIVAAGLVEMVVMGLVIGMGLKV